MIKVESDALKSLKKIKENENSFQRGTLYVTKLDIKNKIKKEFTVKDKNSSLLSSSEKIRNFNIGNSIIKGGTEFYKKLIVDIKKSEKEKYEKYKKLIKKEQGFGDENEKNSFKSNKKKSKAMMWTKLALLGVAIGAGIYFIKEIYDYITKSQTFLNIKDQLKKLKPISLFFSNNSSKIIDGITSSFYVKTNGGDEISISNKRRSENPVKRSAKDFDIIMKDEVLGQNGGAFRNFLNSYDPKNSPIGYFISQPLFYFFDKLRLYLIKSFSELNMGRWRDVYQMGIWFINDKIQKLATEPILNPFAHLNLKTQDRKENIKIKAKEKIEEIYKSLNLNTYGTIRKKILLVNEDGGEKVILTISNPEDVIKKFESKIDSNDILKLRRTLKNIQEENIKVEFYSEGLSDTKIRLVVIDKNGNKKSLPPELTSMFGMYVSHVGHQFYGDKGGKDAKKELLNVIQQQVDIFVSELKAQFKESESIYGDMLAQKMYTEHFLKPNDIALQLLDSTFEYDINDVNSSFIESEIYFNKSKSSKEKMDLIIQSYFTKENNFFLRYISKLEKTIENEFGKFASYINFFDIDFSPFQYSSSHIDDKHEVLKTSIKNFYGDRDLLITDSSLSEETLKMSYENISNNIRIFSNLRNEYRLSKRERLRKIKDNFKLKLLELIDLMASHGVINYRIHKEKVLYSGDDLNGYEYSLIAQENKEEEIKLIKFDEMKNEINSL